MIPFFAEQERVTDITDVSSDYRVKENYAIIFADASNGNITVYAPDFLPNRRLSVSKRDSSGNTVTVNFGSSTCNGSSTQIISNQYDTVTCACNKDEWGII